MPDKQKTIREEINGLSDEQLIDKDFAFGGPHGLGDHPAEARLIDEMKKLMEILKRSNQSQSRANKTLITLTRVLIFIGVAAILFAGAQIYFSLHH